MTCPDVTFNLPSRMRWTRTGAKKATRRQKKLKRGEGGRRKETNTEIMHPILYSDDGGAMDGEHVVAAEEC